MMLGMPSAAQFRQSLDMPSDAIVDSELTSLRDQLSTATPKASNRRSKRWLSAISDKPSPHDVRAMICDGANRDPR
jgi:hypothetical protein